MTTSEESITIGFTKKESEGKKSVYFGCDLLGKPQEFTVYELAREIRKRVNALGVGDNPTVTINLARFNAGGRTIKACAMQLGNVPARGFTVDHSEGIARFILQDV